MADYEKLDHWSLRAQKEGYPARSVYKLKEMDEKFGLFKGAVAGIRVLDLGAAPGSWSLYALRKMGSRGFLAAADLSALSRVYDKGLFDAPNFFFLQGDITTATVRDSLLSKGPFHLVMSDLAPATMGNGPWTPSDPWPWRKRWFPTRNWVLKGAAIWSSRSFRAAIRRRF